MQMPSVSDYEFLDEGSSGTIPGLSLNSDSDNTSPHYSSSGEWESSEESGGDHLTTEGTAYILLP